MKQIFTPAVGFQPERNDLQLYAMKMAVACLFRESCHLLLAPPAPVAVALRATRGLERHLHCASHREADTRFACEYPKVPPRLRWVHPHDPVFFITFCTQQRRKLLASDTVHAAFVSFGTRAHLEQNVAIGRYVIMPDHMHFFVRRPDDLELGRWVGMLKQTLAKQIAPAGTLPIWQRAFLIMFSATIKAKEKNGITFERIPFALG